MFIPFTLLLYQRRSEEFLPRDRHFKLPSILGWVINVAVVLTIPVVVVFFTFPPLLPVNGKNMSKRSLSAFVRRESFVNCEGGRLHSGGYGYRGNTWIA